MASLSHRKRACKILKVRRSILTPVSRKISSTTCDDQSTFSGIPLNVQFGMLPVGRKMLSREWQIFLQRIQKRMRSDYKKLNVTMQFTDNQTTNVQLELCSLKLLSGTVESNEYRTRLSQVVCVYAPWMNTISLLSYFHSTFSVDCS